MRISRCGVVETIIILVEERLANRIAFFDIYYLNANYIKKR